MDLAIKAVEMLAAVKPAAEQGRRGRGRRRGPEQRRAPHGAVHGAVHAESRHHRAPGRDWPGKTSSHTPLAFSCLEYKVHTQWGWSTWRVAYMPKPDVGGASYSCCCSMLSWNLLKS